MDLRQFQFQGARNRLENSMRELENLNFETPLNPVIKKFSSSPALIDPNFSKSVIQSKQRP